MIRQMICVLPVGVSVFGAKISDDTSSATETPQPFFASAFTLSSHHPFVVPEKYDATLPEGKTNSIYLCPLANAFWK